MSTRCLLMTGRPPSSTLFPYTTLFRSGVQERQLRLVGGKHAADKAARARDEIGVEDHLAPVAAGAGRHQRAQTRLHRDRKSTRLNSSHSQISYAVFCLKKKKEQ